MQKHVNLVDLVKSFPTNIYFQNLASIQKRTSTVKFAHLAEKSEKGSMSNLSTKVAAALSCERFVRYAELAAPVSCAVTATVRAVGVPLVSFVRYPSVPSASTSQRQCKPKAVHIGSSQRSKVYFYAISTERQPDGYTVT